MKIQPSLAPQNVFRMIWNSGKAKSEWLERVSQISREVEWVERTSVSEGIRKSALQVLPADRYAELRTWCSENGVYCRCIRMSGMFSGFSHSYPAGSDLFVVAISSERDQLNDPESGLGYPECCVSFFKSYFPLVVDPIWQWAGGVVDSNEVKVLTSPYANPLLRYTGVRFSFHIPCSPQCEMTLELGKQFELLFNRDTAAWMKELLSMEIMWDCYRGVAIVGTDPFRIVVGSVPTAERYVVRTKSL